MNGGEDSAGSSVETETLDKEYRWPRHAVLSRLMRVALASGPAAIVAGIALLVLRSLPRHAGRVDVLVWLLLTLASSVAVLLTFEGLASRVRTLSSLLDISMTFNYEPPSRVQVAMTTPYHIELTTELDGVRHHLRLASQSTPDHDAVESHLDRVESILTLAAITGSLEVGTRVHSNRVAKLADDIGVAMGLDRQHRRWLRWAALLHDIGKLAVPDEILNKPSSLSAKERRIVQGHVTEGARIISPLIPLLGPWAMAVGEHHERWDGKGYPRRLKGEQISLAGRIMAVADVYATMTVGRIYQRRVGAEAAQQELEDNSGGQFDPGVVEAFIASLRRRRTPAIVLQWPRDAALALQSVSSSLGLPAAVAAATLGLVGAVAVVALTAPALVRALPAPRPVAGIEDLLGLTIASPSPTPARPVAAAVPAPSPRPTPSPTPAPPAPGPPTIRLAPTFSAVEGVALAASGTVTSQAGGARTTVDYGDGTPVQTFTGADLQLAHVYSGEGAYRMTVVATNANGTSTAYSTVAVTDYRLTASLPASIPAQGSTIQATGQVEDPSADTVTATVDYGDGSGVQVVGVSNRTFVVRHTYSAPGSYTITVAVRDDAGASTVVRSSTSVSAPSPAPSPSPSR